ncbi:hypothetical protein K469DRAFT_736034 [Zopfia rhizophila CBS 207.26]|uniref:Uncharacterized protein n=1 Tax=Zopfia rhizophila CBS 207.26 TaxID=1314779 RepID=A0A6A6EM67_9PEZI|nr:hypothetical protein K469DRAFT_736034 [Zopfia rhizophila CBS 207.26]
MDDTEEDYKESRTIFTAIKDTILFPLKILTSPPLLRTYLRTILILLASTALFATAVVAYTSFYYAYIPVRGIDVPVYLQFDPKLTKFPYGVSNIGWKGEGLMSRQKYDVLVEIELSRSEGNLRAGNWMVGLELRGPAEVTGGVKGMMGWWEEWDVEDFSWGAEAGRKKETVKKGEARMASGGGGAEQGVVLARSRRPAILTYRSWMPELVYTALRLPLYAIGWTQEAETLEITMMEGVEFEKGWRNVPSTLRLEVRSKAVLEIYKAQVRFVARLEGLRYIMYTHRLLSFLTFTTLFWSVEMTLVFLTWGILTLLFGSSLPQTPPDQKIKIKSDPNTPATPKTEPESSDLGTPLSDTSRTFSTPSNQQPLHYSSN